MKFIDRLRDLSKTTKDNMLRSKDMIKYMEAIFGKAIGYDEKILKAHIEANRIFNAKRQRWDNELCFHHGSRKRDQRPRHSHNPTALD